MAISAFPILGGVGSPLGNLGDFQINSGTTFGAVSNLNYDTSNNNLILGGSGNTINTVTDFVLINGSGRTISSVSYQHYTAVENLAILNTPSSAITTNLLTWDSSTGKIGSIVQSQVTGASACAGGVDGSIQYNNSGNFGGNSKFCFDSLKVNIIFGSYHQLSGSCRNFIGGTQNNACCTKESIVVGCKNWAGTRSIIGGYCNLSCSSGVPSNRVQNNLIVGEYNTYEPCSNTIIFGSGNTIGGDNSIGGGFKNQTRCSSNSLIIGNNNISCFHTDNSLVIGKNNILACCSMNSFVGGYCTNIIGDTCNSIGFGFCNSVLGDNSVALNNTTSACANAMAIGRSTLAAGSGSFSQGLITIVCSNATAGHSEGYKTISCGNFSHAQGEYTIAIGVASHVGGKGYGGSYVKACGPYSFNHSENLSGFNSNKGANARSSAILGGANQFICQNSYFSGIFAGLCNEIDSSDFGVVIGGCKNCVDGNDAGFVGGGCNNIVTAINGAILGGYNNCIIDQNATILGGCGLTSKCPNTVHVKQLNIDDPDTFGSYSHCLVWNSSDGMVKVVSIPSDMRLKSCICDIPNPMCLTKLNSFVYKYNNENMGDEKLRYGLSAQEVEQYFPEIISDIKMFKDDENLYKKLEYKEMIPIFVETIKELNNRIIVLEEKVNTLENGEE